MNAAIAWRALRRRGGHLYMEQHNLRCKAPTGQVAPTLRRALSSHRRTLTQALEQWGPVVGYLVLDKGKQRRAAYQNETIDLTGCRTGRTHRAMRHRETDEEPKTKVFFGHKPMVTLQPSAVGASGRGGSWPEVR